MASVTIRSTYALDKETVDRLDSLARHWNVSKSEALRRAIRAADQGISADDRVAALDALQTSVRLSRRAATNWIARVRRERKESGTRGSRSR
jgi:predicted transcriptional regulator